MPICISSIIGAGPLWASLKVRGSFVPEFQATFQRTEMGLFVAKASVSHSDMKALLLLTLLTLLQLGR